MPVPAVSGLPDDRIMAKERVRIDTQSDSRMPLWLSDDYSFGGVSRIGRRRAEHSFDQDSPYAGSQREWADDDWMNRPFQKPMMNQRCPTLTTSQRLQKPATNQRIQEPVMTSGGRWLRCRRSM